jgi:hypothetical protein
MPDAAEATAPQVDQPGNKTKPTPYRHPTRWKPVYADEVYEDPDSVFAEQLTEVRYHSKMALPVGWQCPCGAGVSTESGQIACPKCGRVPRDTVSHGKLDGSQRCTTGRQGRDYKRLAKGGRC